MSNLSLLPLELQANIVFFLDPKQLPLFVLSHKQATKCFSLLSCADLRRVHPNFVAQYLKKYSRKRLNRVLVSAINEIEHKLQFASLPSFPLVTSIEVQLFPDWIINCDKLFQNLPPPPPEPKPNDKNLPLDPKFEAYPVHFSFCM